VDCRFSWQFSLTGKDVIGTIRGPKETEESPMNRVRLSLMLLSMSLCHVGCQTVGPNAYQGGLLGTAGGALAGAAIGASDGKPLEGAAIGALTGATVGTLAGDQVDRQNQRYDDVQRASYQQAVGRAVTLEQVVEMTRSGLSEQVIVNQIRANGIPATVNSEQLVWLKNNGVSDGVITAIQTTPPAGSSPARFRSGSAPRVYEEHIYVNPAIGYGPACYAPRYRGCRVPYRYGPRRSGVGISVGF